MSRGGKSPILSTLGNLALLDTPGLGFCGSRKASEKGIAVAVDCAEQAVRAGFTVVSGNAAGVDLAAHRTALAEGGATIMVLAEGIDRFRIRRELRQVWNWERVLVISQFPAEATWQAYRAMERNDVIIALSRALIVVEAGETGGTLAAGLRTLQVGKPLFVADYENIDVVAPGNAQLLAKGAMRLRRSRETGRANVASLQEIATRQNPVQPVLL
jgi:DNA processing protein